MSGSTISKVHEMTPTRQQEHGFWDAFCNPPNLMVEKCEWLFVYILFCFFLLSLYVLYVLYVDFFASPLDLKEDLVVSPGSPQSCPIQLVMLRVCRKDPKGIPHFEINLCTVPHIIGCIRMFFAVYHRFFSDSLNNIFPS